MEGLRWPAMVFGLFSALVAFVGGVIDVLGNTPPGGLIAILASVVLCAVSAMTPSLPGWSAVLFVAAALILLTVSPVAGAFSLPLLVLAAILAAFAAWGRKRSRRPRVT
jgi:hypothetical protein